MWNMTFLIQLITSLISAAAFALIFRLRARYLPWAAIGGGGTFLLYYIVDTAFSSVFAAALLASAFSAIFSEVCARIKQAPAVIFLLPCAIPIVPGGALYRTMMHLISKRYDLAFHYFGQTVAIAIGIAGGIAAVSLIVHLVNESTKQFREWKAKKKT